MSTVRQSDRIHLAQISSRIKNLPPFDIVYFRAAYATAITVTSYINRDIPTGSLVY